MPDTDSTCAIIGPGDSAASPLPSLPCSHAVTLQTLGALGDPVE